MESEGEGGRKSGEGEIVREGGRSKRERKGEGEKGVREPIRFKTCEESGGFGFTVTDGEHTTPLYQFVVTARPLTITMVTQEELMVFPEQCTAKIVEGRIPLVCFKHIKAENIQKEQKEDCDDAQCDAALEPELGWSGLCSQGLVEVRCEKD
ncbi:hypothetical protein WMY93_023758 [Mugilogobius chulae]|uniref:Uncharacterized protein n=1 Tax=Mugilogobius chulae TaxID=88201 RepID=A0AAW0NG96_9GOBI